MKNLRFYFTIDVDWIPGSDKGLYALLDFCQMVQIPATLFFAGRFAEVYPGVLRDCVRNGHEPGIHGWEHGVGDTENFMTSSYGSQRKWVFRATVAVERATGTRPVAFRAPNLWVGETTLKVLSEAGYLLDSSVPARRFDFWYGQCNYLKYFNAPLDPYRPSVTDVGKSGDSPVLEVPPSAFWCIPVNMTALRVLGFQAVTWAVRRLARTSRILVFYLHPSEFVSPLDQSIPTDNPRRHRQDLGPHNFELLDRFVRYVLQLGYVPALLSEELREDHSRHNS